MTVTTGAERIDMVRKKADEWARQLVDLGPRNSVLYFKNTKTASLDLTNADKDALAALLSGKPTRLSALVSDEESHRAACQQVRSCARRIAAFEEEQGIQVGKVAQGLINVPAPKRRPGAALVHPLRAPLLLRTVHIAARSIAQNDFVLTLDDDTELNPVLRYALDQVYGLDIPEGFEIAAAAAIRDADDIGQLPETIHQSLAQFVERQQAVITLEKAIVIGLFHYEKLPMVDDLHQATELLSTHDVVAALAGCQEAMDSLLADDGEPVDAQQLERLDPQDEFLVQDADSSQHQAIMAALAGRNILIEGPPGTGKSQTIANIIAGAAAAGKRVLFVAEKRAAIEAVTDRLARAGLNDLVFDLHRQRLDPRQAAAQLQASLEAMAQQQPVDAGDLHGSLRARRAAVRAYPDELHTRREPWGISAFEAQAELLATSRTRSHVLFRGPQLRALDSRTVADLEAQLQEFVDLGGPRILRHESPWCWANVRDEQDISRVLAELDQLTGRSLRQGQQGIHRLVSSAGLPVPRDFAGWQAVLDLLDRVHCAIQEFGPSVFGQELDAWWSATGPRAARAGFPGRLTFSQRRALVKQVRSASTAGVTRKTALHDRLTEVRRVRDYWRSVGGHEVRSADKADLQHMSQMFAELRTQLTSVAMCARIPDMSHQPTEQVDQKLQALRADQKTLWRMPKITELIEAFERLAVLNLVEDAARSNLSASATRLMFRRAWLESVLDQIRLDSPALREFVADRQNRLVEEFQTDDRKHRHVAAQRVRRAVAVGARRARDEHPDEAQLLKAQAAKKARHLSIRRLVEKAPHVLLALRPCWAMSPLVVSKVLPVVRLFDLVVFDEASQIKPNDAIASIARGRSIVVAGDDKQLPPTNFFDRMLDGSDENDDDGETSELQHFESILTRMRGLLQRQVTLRWHYRSRDERLISFANHFVYGDDLVTFPGAFKDTPVTLDVVDGVASPGQDGSAPEEIRQVVRRVIEHIEQRPHESLGVITMGQKHMDRVEREISIGPATGPTSKSS